MTYTVSTLAKLSGVSVRTLHHYDEIGLLKPAYIGENGYRYYEEEQLLLLQQILFYRELDVDLKTIQSILGRSDFDQLAALYKHHSAVKQELSRLRKLLKTIDKTIQHLEGEQKMEDQEYYQGFSPEKQAEYEEYLVENHGQQATELIAEGKSKVKEWNPSDFEKIDKQHDAIKKALVEAIDKGLVPESIEAQAVVAKHYKVIQNFYQPTRELYIGLGQMYIEHPDFREYYAKSHPDLPEYLASAMRVFAEKHLS